MSRLRALIASIVWMRTARDAPRIRIKLLVNDQFFIITGRNNGCRI